MRRSILWLSTLLLPLLCTPARAADDDFKPIFDGNSLTGWHKNPERIGHGTGGSWIV